MKIYLSENVLESILFLLKSVLQSTKKYHSENVHNDKNAKIAEKKK